MGVVRGAQLAEGKTKIIYAAAGEDHLCIVFSKDRITAHNAARYELKALFRLEFGSGAVY